MTENIAPAPRPEEILEIEYFPMPGTDLADEPALQQELNTWASNFSLEIVASITGTSPRGWPMVKFVGPEPAITAMAADWFGEDM